MIDGIGLSETEIYLEIPDGQIPFGAEADNVLASGNQVDHRKEITHKKTSINNIQARGISYQIFQHFSRTFSKKYFPLSMYQPFNAISRML